MWNPQGLAALFKGNSSSCGRGLLWIPQGFARAEPRPAPPGAENGIIESGYGSLPSPAGNAAFFSTLGKASAAVSHVVRTPITEDVP